MIKITRFQGKEFYINSDLIETIEKTPDTVITLTTGKKIVVMEQAEEIVQRIKNFRKDINNPQVK